METTERILIFTYGSNMHSARLRERAPSAVKIASVHLSNYKLVCNKVSRKDGSAKANVSPHVGRVVWGVLYEVDGNDKARLDRAEGLGYGYNEAALSFIDIDNNSYKAQIYIADQNFIDDNLLPFDWYRALILSGAIQNSLPDEYVEEIKLFESVTDLDDERRNAMFLLAEMG